MIAVPTADPMPPLNVHVLPLQPILLASLLLQVEGRVVQRGPTAADKSAAEPRPKRVRGPAGSEGPAEGAHEEAPSIAALSDLPPQPAPKKRRHERQREQQAQQAEQAEQAYSKGLAGAAVSGGPPPRASRRSRGSSDQQAAPAASEHSVEGALADGGSLQPPAGKGQKEVHGRSVQAEA